jgi:glycosyltransferase involved in cell wall biosynthesis
MSKVLLLARHGRLSPSSRQRMLAYVPHLQNAGCEIACAPLFPDEILQSHYSGERRSALLVAQSYVRRVARLLRSDHYDCLWIEIELLPYVPYVVEKLLLRRRPYVLDIDDAWFHRYQASGNPAVRALLRQKLPRLMRGAREVIVGSPYLEDYASKAGAQRVTCLPTAVDVSSYIAAPSEPSDETVIGWIGTPSNERYVHMIGEVLADVCRMRKARFRVIGARPIDMPNVPTEFRQWREESEARELSEIDIGIMPLAGGVWEQGKCGYKLIQYMAASRAAIASDVGANGGIVQHGVTGFLADSLASWRGHLLQLIDDAALRAAMGREARRIAEAKYDLSQVAPRLQVALGQPVAGLPAGHAVPGAPQGHRSSTDLCRT